MKYKEWLTPENLILIEGWARDGLTLEQIANNIGVRVSTLHEWKSKKPEILDALKRGKEVADYEVENALFKRAKGYDYIEETTEITTVDGRETKHVKKVKKHVSPDTGAAAFWLKNRRPDKWRDRPALDEMGDDKLQTYLDKLESEINVER